MITETFRENYQMPLSTELSKEEFLCMIENEYGLGVRYKCENMSGSGPVTDRILDQVLRENSQSSIDQSKKLKIFNCD